MKFIVGVIKKKIFIFLILSLLPYFYSVPNDANNKKYLQKTVYLFSHGLGGTHKQAYRYTKNKQNSSKIDPNRRYIIDGNLATFDFPDATERFWRVNRANTSFGQYNEIQELVKQYNLIVKEQTESCIPEIILIGVSRGASAAINFAASYQCKYLKALVLESPFDSMNTIIQHQISKLKLSWIPGIQTISKGLTRFIFSEYRENGLHPINTICALSKTLPVLLVCSKKDTLVPCYSTIRLYKKLKQSGHEHVHILILDHGQHAKILTQQQGTEYQNVVHAFYKKYNLPHNSHFALNGESKLKKCTPKI